MQENDAGAAVREVQRIVRGSPIADDASQAAPRLNEPMGRVDIAAVVERIRTRESAAEYRELEASTLALQTKADQQLATLRGLERGNASGREVSAADRALGNTEYAYDDACWQLRMKALSALMGPTSPIARLSWPEKIAIGFREDRDLGDYTDEDIATIAASVEARLSEPSA